MVISKSEFMMFLKHPAWLWLKKYDKNKLPLPDEGLQALFDEGTLFEQYAEKLFKGAVKLGYKNGTDFSGTKYYALPELTEKEIKKGTGLILQGRVEADNITSIFDVLERVGDKTYNLYEIKSSTSVKPEHIPDLAFQTIVLEKAGFSVRNMFVLHVNNKYVRQGEIDPVGITEKSDVTEEVREIFDETKENISKAFEVLKKKEMPDLSPRYLKQGADVMEEWLGIMQAIKGEFPKYSIYKLAGSDPKTIAWLENNGIELLHDIPLDGPLTEKQMRQVEAMKSGIQHINGEEIRDFLDTLKYPLYFLDYETLAGVIPAFDGYRPYQQVPFQYSLHILDKPGGKLTHKEYLHTDNSDPVPFLLEHLQNNFGAEGSVISWYMTFEKSRNKEMGQMHPKYEKFLAGLNERMVDLMVPFSKGWFVDKDFFGKASIKWVLPALLPEFSYKELSISNGGQAQRVWMEIVLQNKNSEKKNQIMDDLREYCNLDTYAMYAIFEYLMRKV
ncbi:MAG: hypothetical protein A3C70_01335 [Candidatus Zambryskibacteria bacterium RIFCSPHIGHO2_02_FULL_43_14]|uniref:DUF2779 domain-containing protein n=1 Tax=Candidatus Zambryskibacteria bacterium RIFCSPHIGHO2_02_FULL_43_14 TaxID=1802748 RepID=A0A1G2TFI9_9BACT|nr:MAG: hypothetical protein A2829_02655 [Candidatus Zambryskibacteria bacterium RIFCSPHIGHO2_01_FULL_43_60]OHA96054.1 MAG: hypothetical protein A3C70_01335 [Candidatus Zambryskibacteria bacterium RIFCSPHIGHO2_02_FULL_43_14]OHB02839.1 MAG: hypothetical protein A3B03_00295 [Candidatus Zambryskibacteria bacterium RIFCSPLOWO2_01_FULL_42_41]